MTGRKAHRMFRRFRTDSAGSATIYGTIILISGIVLGGAAVDTANAWMFRQRLQATADAAALAAALELPDITAARLAAMEIVEENLPNASFGDTIRPEDVWIGSYDSASGVFMSAETDAGVAATSVQVMTRNDSAIGNRVPTYLLRLAGLDGWDVHGSAIATRTPSGDHCAAGQGLLGGLTDYVMVFLDGQTDANWQSSSPGYVGDVAINGIRASERTSGTFAYSGTITTNDASLGAWQTIVSNNPASAHARLSQTATMTQLASDFDTAVAAIRAMPVTAGYESIPLGALNGVDFRDGVNTTYVMNISSWVPSAVINIWGDPGDTFVLRWDTDPSTPALDGQVKFQSGGGINPRGDLMPTNFVNLAGDINASGGGSVPLGLAPYVAGIQNEVRSGGFFTGYWLTLGAAGTRETAPLSTFRIVGGWFTNSIKTSLTSNSAGIHVAPPAAGLLAPCDSPASEQVAMSRSHLVR